MAFNLPGMKGTSIPKGPDYGKMQGNAEDLYKTATSNAGQTMAAATALNNNANKTLQDVTGSELPEMNNVNNVANQNLSTYSNIFSPLQAQQAQEAKDYTSDANVQMLRGRAVADSNSAQQAGRQNAAMALAAEGVDPASIHGGALDRQAAITGAAQNAGAANNSYLNTMDTGRQLVDRANQLGMQVGAAGTAGAQAGSGIGAQIVGNQTSSDAGQVNNLTAANTYLDTGISANTSEANIAHTNFADQLARNHEKDLAQKTQSDSANKWVKTFMAGGGPIPAETEVNSHPIVYMGDAGYGGNDMAAGGPVSGKGALPYSPNPASPTDTVPIMAAPGEFMIPKDVVDHKGNEFFHKLIDSTRLKMNERRAIPRQVFAHKSNH